MVTQVSSRAAHLCAAGIATLLNRIGKPFVTVGVDGSVYRFHPTFKQILDQKTAQLVEPNLEVRLSLRPLFICERLFHSFN